VSAWEASGKSNEWYTPAFVFAALGVRFDLDVAHPPRATHVPCDRYISAHSLDAPWSGFIWMNPPFGGRGDKRAWLNKFFDHGHGIALTPDRTSAPWFREAWDRADLVMFLPKVKFEKPDGSLGKRPGNGVALWAAGPLAVAALYRAQQAGLGIIAAPRKVAA
jgi:hypothetical protein